MVSTEDPTEKITMADIPSREKLSRDENIVDSPPPPKSSELAAVSPIKSSSRKSSDASNDTCSTASTRMSNEIPFIQLAPKVEQLCISRWVDLTQQPKAELPAVQQRPRTLTRRFLQYGGTNLVKRLRSSSNWSRSIEPSRKVLVERMHSGSYNRIVAIKIPKPGASDRELILRIPRTSWFSSSPEREVATVQYVRQKTSIQAPDIIAFDFSSENILKSQYVIYSRIPGVDLAHQAHHLTLTDDQWDDFARQLGDLVSVIFFRAIIEM